MVFAKLSGGVSKAFHCGGHGDIDFLPTFDSARDTDFGHAATQWHRTANEGRATRSAALLSIEIIEGNPFLRDAVNVWRFVAHQAASVVADVTDSDIVTPDH